MDPYRTTHVVDDSDDTDETPEAVLYDTIKRLNNLDYEDAQRVVRALARALAAFVGDDE